MNPTRRALTLATASAALAPAFAQAAYPNRPIRIVIGFTPGGGVDFSARLLAAKLSELLGQNVIVENRPGAGTNIANELVAKAPPDGYTLLMNTSAVTINMSLYKKPGFDVARDFAPVGIFSESQNILAVNANKPYKSVAELIAAARAAPGSLSYASAGSGSTQHLVAELFKQATNTDILHVPYKGSAPATTALLSGEVDIVFINIPALLQHIKSGRVRALAVAGGKRSALLPDAPTLKEASVNVTETVWYGLLAPTGTPKEVVHKLSEALLRAANAPDMRARLQDQGAEPVGNTPDEFGAILKDEVPKWSRVIRAAGIVAE